MRIGEVALSTTRESSVDVTGEILPVPPTEAEKYSYIERSLGLLVLSSVLGGAGVSLALLRLALSSPWLWLLLLPLVFTIPHRLAWFWIVPRGRGFALRPHQLLVESWRPLQYPSVDVFLPVCGEDLRVLRNTWHYVSR
ncbi:MAG: hypothetical protein ABIS59_03060, partial [Candidatus Saccharibacteria bacterium]